ncbi:hypothetical protein, partial [Proteus faecis]|uniref:hypothetical protein n=1 Tax=Proteus faecis TaxID=2050967 RepID=UPI001F39C6A3
MIGKTTRKQRRVYLQNGLIFSSRRAVYIEVHEQRKLKNRASLAVKASGTFEDGVTAYLLYN